MDRFIDDRDYRELARWRSKRDAFARFSTLSDCGLITANDLAQMLGVSVSVVQRKAELDLCFPKPAEVTKHHLRFSVGAIRNYLAGFLYPRQDTLPTDSPVEESSARSA